MKKLLKIISGVITGSIPLILMVTQWNPLQLVQSIPDISNQVKHYVQQIDVDEIFHFFESFETPELPVILPEELLQLNFSGEQAVVIQQGTPNFTEEDLLFNGVWQSFSDLDYLNRVGVANAVIGKESFPTEEREALYIKPTGWNQQKIGNNDWLYHRCHLIGYQMTGENNNMKNLVTGTKSMNTPGMLTIENQVMDYIKRTGNHVRYRVTPVFEGENLLAKGVQIEAQSIENDQLKINTFVFNIQEGFRIDYLTGRAEKE